MDSTDLSNSTDAKAWWVNFASTAKPSPEFINPRLMNVLFETYLFPKRKAFGVLLTDFGHPEKEWKAIYEVNFPNR